MHSKIAIRFCPPVPTWGSQRTFAEEYMPLLLQRMPGSLVYSPIRYKDDSEIQWIHTTNPFTQATTVSKILATLRFQASFGRELRSKGVKVLFCPFHNDGLAFPGGVRQILIVHDVVPLIFPRDFLLSRLLWGSLYRAAIRNSSRVICVSEATRGELIRRLKVPASRLSVVHNGYRAPNLLGKVTRMPRILYVASAHCAHKNIPTLLRGFAQSSLANTYDLRIVAVPHRGITQTIERTIRRFQLGARVHLLEHLSDDEMRGEYSHASLFVYPSLCEGFGLPLLEAMASDLPVCASRISAIPEIAGDAALYFDPTVPAEISHAMETLAHDENLRNKLIARGRVNLERFSWSRSATAAADECRSLLDSMLQPGLTET